MNISAARLKAGATCAAALLVVVALAAQGQEAPVKYFSASDMAVMFAKGGTVTSGANYTVMAAQRTAGGEAELHDNETDIFRIMSGSATFVTGGRIAGAHAIEPGETRGPGIEGGETRTLSAGDVLVIEKGTPHWFKAVEERVEYFVVKVR